jgi:hypothetical protein
MVSTSHNAECTALREKIMPSAPSSESGPRIQNAMASPVVTETAAGACARKAEITVRPPAAAA